MKDSRDAANQELRTKNEEQPRSGKLQLPTSTLKNPAVIYGGVFFL